MATLKTNMAEIATNIFSNAVTPFDPRKLKLVFGSAEYIAAEVFVSKIARKIMKADRSWTDLILVHAISLPFMGGASGYSAAVGDVKTSDYSASFIDGAKGVPAVLAAQWVLNTFSKGFHFPWFNMKDLLITAGAKVITRPIIKSVVAYLPKDAADSLAIVNEMVKAQQVASTFNRT